MDELEPAVASRLRAVMAEFQIVGNRALGEICGATNSAVNNWLCGYNLPRVPEMMRLCEQTGVTLDWLYRGSMGVMDATRSIRLAKRLATTSASR